jgi:DNA adenine methylase
MTLKAPFPYFGGKGQIASLVWERFGDVPNLVDPFFGSGAVLLARPDDHQWWDRTETVNDLDGNISNFWRSVQHDPEAVARHADWIVSECDLHARHAWLLGQRERIVTRLEGDPDWYDAKIAGWWLWGICAWIGSGWCAGVGPWHVEDGELIQTDREGGTKRQRPHLGDSGRGINRQLPHLGDSGQGINRQLDGIEHGTGHAAAWTDHLIDTMHRLSDRLRRVRVCCGDWSRVCGPTPTVKQGVTAVFLDPPYDQDERAGSLYVHDSPVSAAVREWAIQWGDDPRMRIALCSYGEGDGRGRANAAREVVWFSPHCLQPAHRQPTLFEWMEAAG